MGSEPIGCSWLSAFCLLKTLFSNRYSWTVERDARDVRRLLEWLPQARSSRERQALLDRVRDLLDELEQAMTALDELV